MRRASVLAAQLAQRAGTLGASEQAVTAGCCAAGQLRHFAAGPGPTVVANPLQQIVPPILKGIGAAVGGLKGGLAAAADQLTSGPATQGAIAYFADTVLLSGTFVPPSDLDLPKWAAWLAANGYRSKAGWDTLMAGIKAAAPSLEPSDVEALVPALHAVGRYDRALFEQFADIVKARFTEFETAGLAKLLPTFAAHDYFDQALWDDVADSITYCNHYMAPSRIPLADVAALFSAYAKYEVDRGDLFVTLARTIHEDRLKALDDEELKAVLGGLLGAFKSLSFYPDCTQALLLAGRLRPSALGPAENALMVEVEAALREHAPEGQLPWLDGGFKDWEHFHGTAFGSYNLWVAREELVPQYYRPSDISPRPASMTSAPPEPTGSAGSS
ncbi:hypothetical protein OEZ85_010030 [Tetradesmus obliquus]|uniref:Uncharacterized protein n=1 Tax=Tetradesmus obliquus TaxID=3088 RepID=A0ABY8UBW5_TETOB|nr:hypothetical protein OEZ85_010030 [Tetradesmus obliquus]